MRFFKTPRFIVCAALLIAGGCQAGTPQSALPQGALVRRSAAVHHLSDARAAAITTLNTEVRAFHGQIWRSAANVAVSSGAYAATIDGRSASIYTGTLRSNPSQGVLIVIDNGSRTAQLAAGPVGAGALRVKSVSGRDVYVATATGRTTRVAIPYPLGESPL